MDIEELRNYKPISGIVKRDIANNQYVFLFSLSPTNNCKKGSM